MVVVVVVQRKGRTGMVVFGGGGGRMLNVIMIHHFTVFRRCGGDVELMMLAAVVVVRFVVVMSVVGMMVVCKYTICAAFSDGSPLDRRHVRGGGVQCLVVVVIVTDIIRSVTFPLHCRGHGLRPKQCGVRSGMSNKTKRNKKVTASSVFIHQ